MKKINKMGTLNKNLSFFHTLLNSLRKHYKYPIAECRIIDVWLFLNEEIYKICFVHKNDTLPLECIHHNSYTQHDKKKDERESLGKKENSTCNTNFPNPKISTK